jgi:hypothetical protein
MPQTKLRPGSIIKFLLLPLGRTRLSRLHRHCVDKDRLLAAYTRSVIEWSETVRNLSDHAGSPDFSLLISTVNDARTTTERTKSEYAAHLAEHGC